METVEVVIRIPKDEYGYMIANPTRYQVCDDEKILYNYIKHGTVLPKGHGRLGDLDALEMEINNGIRAGNYEEGYEDYGNINDMDDCVDAVRFAPTVIEADKEGENDTQIHP